MFKSNYGRKILLFSLVIIAGMILIVLLGYDISSSSISEELEQNLCGFGLFSSGVVITDSKGTSSVCVPGINQQPLTWKWTPDGAVLAYALPGDNPPPPLDGRHGYYQRPATKWFVKDIESDKQIRFQVADNQAITFSPNGQYIIVHYPCYYESCANAIYQADIPGNIIHEICQYKTRTVWLGESNCPRPLLDNGQKWDIERDITQNGCASFKENGWGTPPQCRQ